MIPRSLSVVFLALLLLLAVNGEYSSYSNETYENDFPSRWGFPALLNYLVTLKGTPTLQEFLITISLHRVHDNSPLSLGQAGDSVCDIHINTTSPPLTLARAEFAYKEDGVLTLTVALPTPTPIDDLGIICRDVGIEYPSTEPDVDTASKYTITIHDNNNDVIWTNTELVTIIDAPFLRHDFHWGGEHREKYTDAIHVSFTFYFPPRALKHQQFSILHPLLNLNKITSMHSPPDAKPGVEYERLYNFLPLGIEQYPPAIVLQCNELYGGRDNRMSLINFPKDKTTGEIRPYLQISDRISADEPYMCSFVFPYPPNVIEHLLKTAPTTTAEPPCVKITPLHSDPNMEVELPIHIPPIIPEYPPEYPNGLHVWTLPHYAHDNMAEFEISINVLDRYRDSDGHLSVIPTIPDAFTFILIPQMMDAEVVSPLADWSPVIACKHHSESKYPQDTPLHDGMIDLKSTGFSGFGQMCRIRLTTRGADVAPVWEFYLKAYANGELMENSFKIALFTPMHIIEEELPGLVLVDRGHGRGKMAFHGLLSPSASLSPSSQISTNFESEDSSVAATAAANALKPIQFTKYIDPESKNAYAVGEFNVELQLPGSIDLAIPTFLLRLVFPELVFNDLYEFIPDHGNGIDAILTIHHGNHIIAENIPFQTAPTAYDFSSVLGAPHDTDPHTTILHPGGPLRSVNYFFAPPEVSIVLEPSTQYQFTVKFGVHSEYNRIDDLVVYPMFISVMHLYTYSNPHPYAIVTPLDTPSTGGGRSNLPVIIGVIAAVALVMTAGVLLCCKFTKKGLFRQRKTHVGDELSSPLSPVSAPFQKVPNSINAM